MGAMKEAATTLYKADHHAWTQEQAAGLRCGNFTRLDVANLVEEIESLRRTEERELESRLEQLLMHLLNWERQPYKRGNLWTATIREQRRRVERLFKHMPSLQSKADDFPAKAYPDAVFMFDQDTGLGTETLPKLCPYTVEQVLTSDWLPSESSHHGRKAFARMQRLGGDV